MNHLSDEMLMAGVRQGKEEDFELLYSRYAKRMMAYFYRMLWHEEEKAQDFLQDLFIKVLEKAKSFHLERSFEAWIYSIASNMCKNEYRKNYHHKTFIQQQELHSHYHPKVEEAIDHEMYEQRINQFVEELEADQKELFVLRFEEKLSIDQIASILQVKPGTIKSRIFYLKRYLAAKMQLVDPNINERYE